MTNDVDDERLSLKVQLSASRAREEKLREALIGVINALDYGKIDNGCLALDRARAIYKARLAIAPPRQPRYAKDICEACRRAFAHDENDGLVTCRECASTKPDEAGT